MVMQQAELSQRFYKKQKLQKIANKLLEDWQRNPATSHSLQDVKNQISNICTLPRGWTDQDYEQALQTLDTLKIELQTTPIFNSNIPKLTDLLIASLNMVNAGSEDKAGALIDAWYRTQGFNGLETLYDSLEKIIQAEHDRQRMAASLQGYYDPRNVASNNNTQITKTKTSAF